MEEKKEDRYCLKCGKLILGPFGKKFCNAICRIDLYNERKKKPKKITYSNCLQCNNQFLQIFNNNKKFCSLSCLTKYRWKHNENYRKKALLDAGLKNARIKNSPDLLKIKQEYHKKYYVLKKQKQKQQDINTNNKVLP